MLSHARIAFLPLFLALALPLSAGASWIAASAQSRWDAKAAAGYLDGRAAAWLAWSGAARGQGTACVSCHTTLPLALARPALGRQPGDAEAGAAETALLASVGKRVENWRAIVAGPAPVTDPFVPF